MSKLDYYNILGINKNSDEKDIKRAYKKLAMKFHPDRNPGNIEAEKKFKEIKEAYEILIDKNKRKLYDQYGHSAFENNYSNYSSDSTYSYHFSSGFGDIFGDIFGEFFGKNKDNYYKNDNKSENDICYNIDITFEESVIGCKKDIKMSLLDYCNLCNGSGLKKGTYYSTCNTCKGSGKISIRQGFFLIQQTCNVCNGNKKIIKYPCSKCNGKSKIIVEKIINIKIPSGINSGDQIKIDWKNISNSKSNRNIYIKVNVKDHNIFKRKNDDLYCDIPINFSIAALGGEIFIPTIDGKVKLKIPKETQTGKLFKIKNKGIYNSKRYIQGDLFCRVIVETPVNLDIKQKELLKKLGDSLSNSNNLNNSPKFRNFIDSLKKFFNKF